MSDAEMAAPSGDDPGKHFVELLLVEDNALHVRLVTSMLEEVWRGQYQLTHVNRLDTAIDRIRVKRPDCVLLDLMLPDATGLEAVHTLHSSAPTLPIVVVSAHEDPQFAGQALREGAQDYLVKGELEGGRLVRAVTYAIDRARSAPVPVDPDDRDHDPAGTAVLNPDGAVIRADAGFGEMLGRAAKDVVGLAASGYVAEDHLGGWLRTLQRQMDAVAAGTVRGTTVLRRADGATVPATADVTMLRDAADRPAGFVVSLSTPDSGLTDDVIQALAAGTRPVSS